MNDEKISVISSLTDEELRDELVARGWVWGYLSGHGDSECVFQTINDKWLVVADVEKEMILCPPKTKAREPWEY